MEKIGLVVYFVILFILIMFNPLFAFGFILFVALYFKKNMPKVKGYLGDV